MLRFDLPEFRQKNTKAIPTADEFMKRFLALGSELNFAPRHLQPKGTESCAFPSPPTAFSSTKTLPFSTPRELLPYLRDLGVSDVYASPIFLAGPESTHGYDICGFDQINPNLGTTDDFDAFRSRNPQAGHGSARGHGSQSHGHAP